MCGWVCVYLHSALDSSGTYKWQFVLWCLIKQYIVESKDGSGEVICVTYWDRGKQSDAETRKKKEES